jgi:hypothetical protein
MTELTEVPFKPRKIKQSERDALQENFSTFLESARVYHRLTTHPPEELHWKDRLVALIPKADFQMYDRAVVHFTGGPLYDVSEDLEELYLFQPYRDDSSNEGIVFETMMLVKTDGYWECIGA